MPESLDLLLNSIKLITGILLPVFSIWEYRIDKKQGTTREPHPWMLYFILGGIILMVLLIYLLGDIFGTIVEMMWIAVFFFLPFWYFRIRKKIRRA